MMRILRLLTIVVILESTEATQDCGVPPSDENSQVTYTDTTVGGIATYVCNSGYVMVGEALRTCQSSLSWSGKMPGCLYDCGPPESPVNGFTTCPGGTLDGALCLYHCNPGFTLNGSVDTICYMLEWDYPPGTCQPIVPARCMDQWSSTTPTFEMWKTENLSSNYSLLESFPMVTDIHCVRVCSRLARQNCGLPVECSLVTFDTTTSTCVLYHKDSISGSQVACTSTTSCYYNPAC